MTAKPETDVLIVGGGIMGSSCGYWISKGRHSVSLIDRGDLPNPLSQSGDHLKTLRLNFGGDPFYTELASKSRALWLELNAQWSEKLFEQTGVLEMISGGGKKISQACEAVEERHLKAVRMDKKEISRNYPTLKLSGISCGVLYPEAGLIWASRAVIALSSMAQKQGLKIHPRTGAVSLLKEKGAVAGVRDEKGRVFKAGSYVFALGPWTQQLLGIKFPVKVTRQPQLYVRPPANSGRYRMDHFPVTIYPKGFYVYPLHIRGFLKIVDHEKGPSLQPRQMEGAAVKGFEAALQKRGRVFLKKFIPDLAGFRESEATPGFYESTRDGDFILDRLPGTSNAFVISGLADYGLQFAPLIGKAVAAMILGGKPDWNLHRFRLGRFSYGR